MHWYWRTSWNATLRLVIHAFYLDALSYIVTSWHRDHRDWMVGFQKVYTLKICSSYDISFAFMFLLSDSMEFRNRELFLWLEYPRFLWKQKFHYHVYKSPILSKIYPAHSLMSYFFKIYFNIIGLKLFDIFFHEE